MLYIIYLLYLSICLSSKSYTFAGGIGERLNTRAIAYGNSISKGGRDSRVKDGSGSGSGSYGVLQVDTHAPSLTKKVVKVSILWYKGYGVV